MPPCTGRRVMGGIGLSLLPEIQSLGLLDSLVWLAGVGLRDPLQFPLRGPAQPPAAVRSVAREAVPRKQCAFTHVSSFAPSMALYGPANPPPPAFDSVPVIR
jgi:predicted small lipoprotein YifL